MVIPDGDKDLAAELNKIIKQLKDEGFIDQLATKHIGGQ
jgi:ABC-type amino acid transport substrate-binding protein